MNQAIGQMHARTIPGVAEPDEGHLLEAEAAEAAVVEEAAQAEVSFCNKSLFSTQRADNRRML